METQPVVSLEENKSCTLLGLHNLDFSTKEVSIESAATSDNGSPDNRGGDCIPEDHGPVLEPEDDIPSSVCVVYNNAGYSRCFQEPKKVSGEGFLDAALLLEENIVFESPTSNKDFCWSISPPASAEIQSNCTAQTQHGQTLDLIFGCAKTDFKGSVSNGAIPKLDSAPAPVVPAGQAQRVLDLPHTLTQKSTITFSDSTCPLSFNSHAIVHEISDGEESSEGREKEEDGDPHHDDDNEVFVDLPHTRNFHVKHRERQAGKDKKARKCFFGAQAEIDPTPSSCGYEAEEETSSKEVSFSGFSVIFVPGQMNSIQMTQ